MSKPYAYIWHCGDDVCDCTQPQILITTPRPDGRGFDTKEVEAGPFHSEADSAETREQYDWLLAAAERHAVSNLADIRAQYAERYSDSPKNSEEK